MSVWRPVDTRLWGDRKFRSLTPLQPCGQAAWLYLLTTSAATAFPGLLNLGAMQMAEDLRWKEPDVEKALAEIERAGMMKRDRDMRVIWLPRALAYNPPQSPNVVRGWGKRLATFPESNLVMEAVEALGEDMHRMFEGQAGEASFRAAFDSWAQDYRKRSQAVKREADSGPLLNEREAIAEDITEGFTDTMTDPIPIPRSKPIPREKKHRSEQADGACPSDVERIFRYWKDLWLVREPLLSPARRRCIQKAIDDFGVDGTIRCLAGYRTDVWTERHEALSRHDLTLLLRDANHVERGLDLAARCPDQKLAPWLPVEIRLRHPGSFRQAWESGLVDLAFKLSPAEAGTLRSDMASGKVDRNKWRRLFECLVGATLAEPPNSEIVAAALDAIRGKGDVELPEGFKFSEAAVLAIVELRAEAANG